MRFLNRELLVQLEFFAPKVPGRQTRATPWEWLPCKKSRSGERTPTFSRHRRARPAGAKFGNQTRKKSSFTRHCPGCPGGAIFGGSGIEILPRRDKPAGSSRFVRISSGFQTCAPARQARRGRRPWRHGSEQEDEPGGIFKKSWRIFVPRY